MTTTKTNEDLVTWDLVRRWFNFPSLAEPRFEPEVKGGAYFNFKTLETVLGEDFIAEVQQETGLSRQAILKGIYTHEIGHYMEFPRNLSTIILTAKFLTDHQFKEGEFIFQTYADMHNDLESALDWNRQDAILDLREASYQTIKGTVDKKVRGLMLNYLHHQAKRPYTVADGMQDYFDRMMQIDFQDRSTLGLRLSTYQFGSIIKDIMEEHGNPEGQTFTEDMSLKEALENATPKQIEDAMRHISGKVRRGEYKRIKEWLDSKGVLPKNLTEDKNIAIGTSKGKLTMKKEVADYYLQLAKSYPLIVEKKPIPTEVEVRTMERNQKWKMSQPPMLALPQHTGGLLLPGLSRAVKIDHHNQQTVDYDLPHLLVAIDSSGSMPHPEQQKSFAALGGTCAARSYHLHGSHVGVLNFSGESFYVPFTRDLDQAVAGICAYLGGGTTIDIDMLKKMLGNNREDLYNEDPEHLLSRLTPEQRKRAKKKDVQINMGTIKKALDVGSIDLLMFTDGGIGNLNEVLDYFESRGTLNRA